MQTPDPVREPRLRPRSRGARRPRALPAEGAGIWNIGGRLAWIAGLVLTLSAFTNWYSGPESTADDITISVTGWDTGPLGKLVFFVGVAIVLLVILREAGVELPAAVPESLVVIALGSLATIFVLIRVISIPDDFFFAGRGVGICISLAAALAVIAAGLLQASEEL